MEPEENFIDWLLLTIYQVVVLLCLGAVGFALFMIRTFCDPKRVGVSKSSSIKATNDEKNVERSSSIDDNERKLNNETITDTKLKSEQMKHMPESFNVPKDDEERLRKSSVSRETQSSPVREVLILPDDAYIKPSSQKHHSPKQIEVEFFANEVNSDKMRAEQLQRELDIAKQRQLILENELKLQQQAQMFEQQQQLLLNVEQTHQPRRQVESQLIEQLKKGSQEQKKHQSRTVVTESEEEEEEEDESIVMSSSTLSPRRIISEVSVQHQQKAEQAPKVQAVQPAVRVVSQTQNERQYSEEELNKARSRVGKALVGVKQRADPPSYVGFGISHYSSNDM